MAQIGISFAFFNLMWFSDFLEGIVSFNSATGSMAPLLYSDFYCLAFRAILVKCLYWLSNVCKRRFIVATSITILLFGGSYLVQYSNKPEFNPRPQYDATIMMPSFLIAPSASVDEFIEDSSKLFDKTKEEALKD